MHSSRMRTARSSSRPGMSPPGTPWAQTPLPQPGTPPRSRHQPPPPQPPWTEFLTHASENITLLRLRAVKKKVDTVTSGSFVYLVGTALVLAKMPHDKISEGLKELCTPQVTPLNKVRTGKIHNLIYQDNNF